MKHILKLSILLFSSLSFSEVYRLDSALNVRDAKTDFTNENDVIGHVSAGTNFEIVSSQTLHSGAKALEIKIIKRGKGTRLSDDDEKSGPIYIYQSKDRVFEKISNTQSTEAGVPCTDGSCNKTASQVDMAKQPIVKTLGPIAAKVEEQNSVPKTMPDNISPDLLEKINKYSTHPLVQKTIKVAIDKYSGKKFDKRRKCYKGVKDTMLASGLIKGRPPGLHARLGIRDLKEKGFDNLLDAPFNIKYTYETAPTGCLLVYDSARSCDKYSKNVMGQGCGDIAIKLGDGSKTNGFKYSNDNLSKTAIMQHPGVGHKYKLSGVMCNLNM